MKKGKKKIIIGAVVLLAAAGGYAAFSQSGAGQETVPQVEICVAEKGDVQQIIDASGTVTSQEEKTYFSPVNATVSNISVHKGDTVKKGEKLVTFDTKNLEKDNQRAELSVRSGETDYRSAVNKSEKAVQKQSDAKEIVTRLEKQVEEKKREVASLRSQISALTIQAQRQAQTQAQEAAVREAQAVQEQARAEQQAKAEQERRIQEQYAAALAEYQNHTLPEYQKQLSELNKTALEAQTAYNKADLGYEMAFAWWQTDPSEEKRQALVQAEQERSAAQIGRQQAEEAYSELKNHPPAMPSVSDFSVGAGASLDFVSDGSEGELTDHPVETAPQETVSVQTAAGQTQTYTAVPDTSGLETRLEAASSALAELQSELASEKAVAESEPAALTEEDKEKMEISSNLTQLDAKTAKELVEEGKKGITAEFNGIISRADIRNGAFVSQGMDLITIQNTDKVSVDIKVSKYDYDKIKEGQKADIVMGSRTYEGTVTRVSHIAEKNEKGSSVVAASVSIDNPDDEIFLGVDAKVTIYAKKAEDAVVLPVEVINIGKNGSFCYVLDEESRIQKRDVVTGISSDYSVEIVEGIRAGEQVVRDLGDLEEGTEVQAVSGTGEDAR